MAPDTVLMMRNVPLRGEKKVKDNQVIQWGGALHKRNDFNKRKDMISNWAETMFGTKS